jgi:hypothetical protein
LFLSRDGEAALPLSDALMAVSMVAAAFWTLAGAPQGGAIVVRRNTGERWKGRCIIDYRITLREGSIPLKE